tara:strand:+ start:75 stop:518 length:444 start_codon:yes stop_codon:yes gene_type:complete
MKDRFKVIPTVYLFVKNKDDEVLLLKRHNTGFFDDWYSLPAGHVDGNETAVEAAIREAKEEVNIDIDKKDISLKLTVHRKYEDREYVEFFFEVSRYSDTLNNNEPHKCSEIKFFDMKSLPDNTIDYIKDSIIGYRNNEVYLDHGFSN